jgi:MFS family permease
MWVLGLVVLVDEIDKSIVRGLIDPLEAHFGVGDFAIGVLLSMQLLFNGIITVPAGYLADRWHRTKAIGTTVVVWSGLSAAGAGATSFGMLVGLRSLLGFGQAVSEPSAASLLGDYYPPERRGKAFSIQMVMLFVGTGVGVALGGALGLAFWWRCWCCRCASPSGARPTSWRPWAAARSSTATARRSTCSRTASASSWWT